MKPPMILSVIMIYPSASLSSDSLKRIKNHPSLTDKTADLISFVRYTHQFQWWYNGSINTLLLNFVM